MARSDLRSRRRRKRNGKRKKVAMDGKMVILGSQEESSRVVDMGIVDGMSRRRERAKSEVSGLRDVSIGIDSLQGGLIVFFGFALGTADHFWLREYLRYLFIIETQQTSPSHSHSLSSIHPSIHPSIQTPPPQAPSIHPSINYLRSKSLLYLPRYIHTYIHTYK